MPEFLSPGVFIEEVDAGPKPIEGVSTSTAGAVGVTTFGPTEGKPVLVTSFAEFTRIFGPPMPEPTGAIFNKWAHEPGDGGRWWQFALSIKGFFDNGGQRIFVKRVFSSAATAASAGFGQGLISEIEADAAADDTLLKLSHLIGIAQLSTINIFSHGDQPSKIGEYTVVAYDASARTVTLDKVLGKQIQAGRDFVEIHPRQSNNTFTVKASAFGDWGNHLQASVQPMVGATASLLGDPATGGNPFKTSIIDSSNAPRLTWVIELDSTTGLQDGTNVTINNNSYPISNFDSETKTFEIDSIPPAGLLTPDEAVGTTPVTVKWTDSAKAQQTGTIKSGGTRRAMSVEDATGLANGTAFFFIPTGKRFKITADPVDKTLRFAPAMPVGKNWVGLSIASEHGTPTTTVSSPLTKTVDTLDLDDVRGLQNNDLVEINKNLYRVKSSTVTPAGSGGDGKKGTIQVDPKVDPSVTAGAAVTRLDKPTMVTDNFADWKIAVDDATGFSANDHVLINGEDDTVERTSVPDKTVTVYRHQDSGTLPWPPGTLVRRLRPAATAHATVVNVAGATQLYTRAIVELDNGLQKETRTVQAIDGDAVTLSAPLTNAYHEGNRLRVVEARIDARYVINGKVVQQESFTNLRLADDKTSSYFVTAIKNGSSLIEIADPLGPGFPTDLSDLSQFPTPDNGGLKALDGGDDHLEQLTVDDFVGEDGGSGHRTGIQALEDIDEVSICLVPDVWSPTVHDALILHCETLKDRFAILDPQDGLGIQEILAVKENLDSKYAALYYPWLEVRNSFISQNVQVAPSGHVAGIYARVDVERGVHKAPANEIIRGITQIAADVNTREQDLLNPKGINVLRFFPGRSNLVWGARTISSDSSWKYVNVRRLFIFVEKSINEGTQFVVFEPNSDPTWARVRQTITNFLTTVWRSGALQGTTADQAFFVKCDRTTMSQDDIDNGRLICVIGIAPVKPAEFVIFEIQQFVQTQTP